MKKVHILLLSLIVCITFASCKNDNSNSETTTTTNQADSSSEILDAKKDFDTQKIMAEINSKFTFSDMTQFDDSLFLDVMYGISADDVKQFGMMINETGISADEIIIIEGVDADATSRILEAISNWYTAKGVQMKDYIPKEYEKIEKCQVHNIDNVVYMVVLDNFKDVEEIIESYLK